MKGSAEKKTRYKIRACQYFKSIKSFNQKYFWHTRAAIGHATALAVARRARVAEHALRRTRVCPRAHDDDLLYPPTHPVAY